MSSRHWIPSQGSQVEAYNLFLRCQSNLRAFCLGVTGFANPPIGQTLVSSLTKNIFGAFCIANLERCAAVMTEIEISRIAVQVSFAAMPADYRRK